ncbi:MAG: hypothetical protein AAF587_14120 [Bacteroidota bacterium]
MTKTRIILLIFLSGYGILRSQIPLTDIPQWQIDAFNERNLSLSMFVDKFNEAKSDAIAYADSTIELTDGEMQLIGLFDLQKIQQDSTKLLQQKMLAFTHIVSRNQLFIKPYGQDLIAKAHFHADYLGEEVSITLFLQKVLKNGGLFWTIIGVQDIDFLLSDQRDSLAFVPPNSADAHFISLIQVLRNTHTPVSLVGTDIQIDYFSIFLYAIQRKDLTLQYLEDMSFHFLDVDGWAFSVKECNRLTSNSGWLISELVPTHNKQDYLISIGLQPQNKNK